MRYRLMSFAFAVCLGVAQSGHTAEAAWRELKPGLTTEDHIIFLFGVPDIVTVAMNYKQFSIARNMDASPLPTLLNAEGVTYSYNNLTRKDLAVLNGPLGVAQEAAIWIKSGKFQSIEWSYHFPPALQDVAAAGFDLKEHSAHLVTGLRRLPAGDLFAFIPQNTVTKMTVTFRSRFESTAPKE